MKLTSHQVRIATQRDVWEAEPHYDDFRPGANSLFRIYRNGVLYGEYERDEDTLYLATPQNPRSKVPGTSQNLTITNRELDWHSVEGRAIRKMLERKGFNYTND
jgi:hypothetical protein